MKKLVLVAALLAFATTSFAADVSILASTSVGGSPFTPSKLVTLMVSSTKIAYTATSCHLNGTLEYATVGGNTTDDVSTIFNKAIPAQGTNDNCAPTSPGTAGSLPSGF